MHICHVIQLCSICLYYYQLSFSCFCSGADKEDNNGENKNKKIYRGGAKIDSHSIESKTHGSYRHSKTQSNREVHCHTSGDDQMKPSGLKKVVNGMGVDAILCHGSSYPIKKQVSQGNAIKLDDMDGETRELPTKRRRVDYDIFRILADSILDEGVIRGEVSEQEAQQSCSDLNALNYKFRFEDEDLEPVEKSELEIEVEQLFSEMDFCLKCEEIGSFNRPMVCLKLYTIFCMLTTYK